MTADASLTGVSYSGFPEAKEELPSPLTTGTGMDLLASQGAHITTCGPPHTCWPGFLWSSKVLAGCLCAQALDFA